MFLEKFTPDKTHVNFFYSENEIFKPIYNYPSNSILPPYTLSNLFTFNNCGLSNKIINEQINNKHIPPLYNINKKQEETENFVNFNINYYNNIYMNRLPIPILPISYDYYPFMLGKKFFGDKSQIYNRKKKQKPFLIKKIKKKKNKNKGKTNKKSISSRQDNDRVKFVRQTLNYYFYNKLTNLIRTNNKIIQKLRKFPEKLINEIAKLNNKKYLNMTLEDLYLNKELYTSIELLNHFEYNLVIINRLIEEKNKEFREKSGVEILLKMKFGDLIKEYLQSAEYKQKMNELNETNGTYFAEKFKYFAINFINNYHN